MEHDARQAARTTAWTRWARGVGTHVAIARISAGLALWRHHLLAALPATWRRVLAPQADERWLLPGAGGLLVRHPDGSSQWLLDSSAPDTWGAVLRESAAGAEVGDLKWMLCLPLASILYRRVYWPAIAAREARIAMRHQLEQLTPFPASSVVWDVQIGAAPGSAGKVAVDLYAAPRRLVDPWCQHLAAAGIALTAIDVLTESAQRLGVDLRPADARLPGMRPVARRTALLAALAVALLLGLGLQWRAAVHDRLAPREMRLEQLSRRASTLEAQAARIEANQRARIDMGHALAARPSMEVLLDDLSHRLPTSTWVQRFDLRPGGEIELQGLSPDVPALIAVLKASPYLRAPAIRGTVQPDPTSGKESFLITARLAGSALSHATGVPDGTAASD